MTQPAPDPRHDEDIAAICRWLKERHLTMHVSLLGGVTLRKKPEKRE